LCRWRPPGGGKISSQIKKKFIRLVFLKGYSISSNISIIEVIGDAHEVQDIFTAIHAGYELAKKY